MNVPRETYPKKVKDFFLTGEEFSLLPHPKYEGVLMTSPQPNEQDLPQYYDSDEYISHTDSSQSLTDKLYQTAKRRNLYHKYSIIKKDVTIGNILDFGCGTGDFLHYMKSKGFETYGFEPNEKAAQKAVQKLGSNSVRSFNELGEQNYDVITLWHVLEHLPDLDEKIQWFKNHLKSNGQLYIAVPNFLSYDAKYYKEFWAAWDVPRHLWHFSPDGMRNMLKSFNLKIVENYPMFFDAFYVSLLSEKYKQNSFPMFRALKTGTVSNLKAQLNGNFSSIIYKIEHKN